MILECLVAVLARARSVADFGKKIGHAAMGMDVSGIGPQRGFKMKPGLLLLVHQEQEIGQIDAPVGIIRVMPHGLAIERPRRVLVSGFEHQRAEVAQDAEVGRRAAKQFQVVALGFVEQTLLAQQAGSFEVRLKCVGIPRKLAVEIMDTQNARSRTADHRSLGLFSTGQRIRSKY